MRPPDLLDEEPLFWPSPTDKRMWFGGGPNLYWALPDGELDTQLESLFDEVWRCEAAAAVEDRIELSLRWEQVATDRST